MNEELEGIIVELRRANVNWRRAIVLAFIAGLALGIAASGACYLVVSLVP